MLVLVLSALLLQTGSALGARRLHACLLGLRPAEACRIVRDFELRGPKGQRLPVRTDGSPTPSPPQGNILLFVGETVTARLAPEGDRLVPQLVRSGAAAHRQAPEAGELRVSLAQAPDAAVLLKLESRLSRPMDYGLAAVSAISGPSTPPTAKVPPGRTTTERWTGAVAQVAPKPRPVQAPRPGSRAVG